MNTDSIVFADGDIEFMEEESKSSSCDKSYWKVLIADDEEEIHAVTKLALRHFSFEDRSIAYIHAYSGAEAKQLLAENPDTAVILLDVVMESDDAGLQVAKYIRETLNNRLVRIILRTGQPGAAPEKQVILNYEINEYKTKTELTTQKLFTTFIASLRNYRDLRTIESNRKGLEKIVDASGSLFEIQSMEQFIAGLLTQLTSLLHLDEDAFYCGASCFASAEPQGELKILAGTGAYADCNNKLAREALPVTVFADLQEAYQKKISIYHDNRCVIYFFNKNKKSNMAYLETSHALNQVDKHLLEVFCANTSIAIDNIYLNDEIEETQKEVIFRMGSIAETRCKETGNHVKRVAEYSELFAIKLGLTDAETELLKQASPMHDIGKIGIPDSILNKQGKLTPDEWEIMKSHAQLGRDMLIDSNRPLLKAAAIVAYQHHEKWDGGGYPQGLHGEAIHIFGRITALADVFDALGSFRCYKEPWPLEKILDLIKDEKGKQFDPAVVDVLFDHLPEFLMIRDKLSDQ